MKMKVALASLLLAGIFGAAWASGSAGRAFSSVVTKPKPALAAGSRPEPPGEPVLAPAIVTSGAIRSAGCDKSHQGQAGTTAVRTLISDGQPRTYRVHTGASAASDQPLPVVLNFHGRGGSGAAIEQYSGFLPVSDREGFLLVSPDGTGSITGWGAGASLPGWPVDDIQFGRDLLQTLKQDFCIDSTRIYAVGHSNGAFMASRLACDLPGEIAAIAPVAGIYVPPEGCSTPVPVLAFHGTADDVVPFGGGVVRETYRYRGAEQELAAWAQTDHCTGTPTTRDLGPQLALEQENQCAQPVGIVLIKGAGHEWPCVAGTDPASQMDTAVMIWDFFKGHQSPAQ
jgi:polyhydroxybutyrate depolymerase